jgi:small subunit ribosomal protein S35
MVEFSKPFEPPNKFQILNFRYVSYVGEKHPAAKKVVMKFQLKHLRGILQAEPQYDDAWEHKFKLLCGPRYNPETDIVHMSCEEYPFPAQNKRYLSDKLDEMIETALVWGRHSGLTVGRGTIRRHPLGRPPCTEKASL